MFLLFRESGHTEVLNKSRIYVVVRNTTLKAIAERNLVTFPFTAKKTACFSQALYCFVRKNNCKEKGRRHQSTSICLQSDTLLPTCKLSAREGKHRRVKDQSSSAERPSAAAEDVIGSKSESEFELTDCLFVFCLFSVFLLNWSAVVMEIGCAALVRGCE